MDPKLQIDKIYEHYCKQESDIVEHMPTLYEYTKECSSVAELGVRGMVSTWAFLKGLSESSGKKELYGVDIQPAYEYNQVAQLAAALGITMSFHQEDSAKITIPPVDMLFIDTFHVYGHLKRELEQHHSRTKKYIVMHDTEGDGIFGEAIRGKFDLLKTIQETGYSLEDITHGLLRAVYEFLHQHPEWKLVYNALNNNGLMILKRV